MFYSRFTPSVKSEIDESVADVYGVACCCTYKTNDLTATALLILLTRFTKIWRD